jgi:hypothetical protein
MSGQIPALDKIADIVLAYRPPSKKKKLAAKAKKMQAIKKKKLSAPT